MISYQNNNQSKLLETRFNLSISGYEYTTPYI